MSTVKFDSDFDLTSLTGKLRGLMDAQYPPSKDSWNEINQVTPSYFIYVQQGKFFKVEYSISGDDPVLGNRTEVKMSFTAESIPLSKLTKQDDAGWKWNIELVEEGLTKYANIPLDAYGPEFKGKAAYKYYTAESVSNSVKHKRFENRPFIIRSEKAHIDYGAGVSKEVLTTNQEAERTVGFITNTSEAAIGDGRIKAVGVLGISNTTEGRKFRDRLLNLKDLKGDGEAIQGSSWTGDILAELENAESATPTLRVFEITEVVSIDPCREGNAAKGIVSTAEAGHSNNKKTKSMKNLKETNPQRYKHLKRLILAKCAEAGVDGTDDASANSALPDSATAWIAKLLWDNDIASVQTHYSTLEELEAAGDDVLVELADKANLKPAGADDAKKPDAAATEMQNAEAAKKVKTSESSPALTALQAEIAAMRIENTANYLEHQLSAPEMKHVPTVLKDGVRTMFKGQTAEAGRIDQVLRDMRDSASNLYSEMKAMPKGAVTDQKDKFERGFMNLMFQGRIPNSEAVVKKATEHLGYNPTAKENFMWRNSLKRAWLDMLSQDEMDYTLWGNAEAGSAAIVSLIATNALNVRLISEYNTHGKWDEWMKVADVVPAQDFRDIEPQKLGHFSGGLGTPSGDGDPYTVLTLDGVEDLTYSIRRRGNLFDITYVDIVNDRIGYLQKAPSRLVTLAKRDLYEQIFDSFFWNGDTLSYNPEPSGSGKFFISTNSARLNRASSPAAIGKTSVIAMRTAMKKQKELGSGRTAGLMPKYILYAPDDYEAVQKVLVPGYGQFNQVATADQAMGLEGIEIEHWPNTVGGGDGNRWFGVADPAVQAPVEVAFLFGRTEPLLVPEATGTGSNFTSEVVRNRITHPWGASAVEHRSVYANILS